MKKAVTVITLMLGMTMACMAQDKFEDADALYNEQGILNMELAPAYNSSGDQPHKNPALAYLFSTIPGVGQFYNDQIGKGFGFIGATLVEFGAFYISLNYLKNPPENVDLAKGDATVMAVISGGALLITYLWSCIDAVIVANKINIDNGYVLKAEPTFNYNNLASMDKPGFTTGLSFSLSF